MAALFNSYSFVAPRQVHVRFLDLGRFQMPSPSRGCRDLCDRRPASLPLPSRRRSSLPQLRRPWTCQRPGAEQFSGWIALHVSCACAARAPQMDMGSSLNLSATVEALMLGIVMGNGPEIQDIDPT